MLNRLILAAAVLSLAVSKLHAEDAWPPIEPDEPELVASGDEAICGAFRGAWRGVFRGEKPLQADWVDWKADFPDLEIASFPPEPLRNGRFQGLYGRTFHRALDFDGDGENEVLHIEALEHGWRYLGARLFLFETEADYRAAEAVSETVRPGAGLLVNRWDVPLDPAPRRLFDYPATSVVFLLTLNGAIYTTASPGRQTAGHPLSINLVRLNGPEGQREVCALDLRPRHDSVHTAIEASPFLQSLVSVYGGGEPGCMGTLGWTARPVEEPLLTLFHRPQAMRHSYGDAVPDSDEADAARELRLLVWGVNDPTSWSVYETLKTGRAAFVGDMVTYYRRHFAGTDSEAQALAELAYRFLVDRIVYARNPDGFRLTRITWHPEERLGFGPESTSETIATAAIKRWLRMNTGKTSLSPQIRYGIWRDAIRAAIYTRQGPGLVRELWAELEAVLAALEPEIDTEQGRQRFEARRTSFLNHLLLAALGDQALMELIVSLGAKVDVPTTWFKKTPLMYAAQTGDLTALRFLLARGADPSARTSDDGARCSQLERDGRTPLMYAAENAPPALIEALLDAGADITAEDSKGNAALWYLDRNQGLGQSEKASLRRRLGEIR